MKRLCLTAIVFCFCFVSSINAQIYYTTVSGTMDDNGDAFEVVLMTEEEPLVDGTTFFKGVLSRTWVAGGFIGPTAITGNLTSTGVGTGSMPQRTTIGVHGSNFGNVFTSFIDDDNQMLVPTANHRPLINWHTFVDRVELETDTRGTGIGVIVNRELVDPGDMIEILAELTAILNLQQGIDNSLDAKLDRAIDAWFSENSNHQASALNSLNAYLNHVDAQRGNHLTVGQASQLDFLADQVINQLFLFL